MEHLPTTHCYTRMLHFTSPGRRVTADFTQSHKSSSTQRRRTLKYWECSTLFCGKSLFRTVRVVCHVIEFYDWSIGIIKWRVQWRFLQFTWTWKLSYHTQASSCCHVIGHVKFPRTSDCIVLTYGWKYLIWRSLRLEVDDYVRDIGIKIVKNKV